MVAALNSPPQLCKPMDIVAYVDGELNAVLVRQSVGLSPRAGGSERHGSGRTGTAAGQERE